MVTKSNYNSGSKNNTVWMFDANTAAYNEVLKIANENNVRITKYTTLASSMLTGIVELKTGSVGMCPAVFFLQMQKGKTDELIAMVQAIENLKKSINDVIIYIRADVGDIGDLISPQSELETSLRLATAHEVVAWTM